MTTAANEIRAYQRKEYLTQFIQNDVRPDNRGLGDTRPAMLTMGAISTADGSAMVKLGHTVAVCGIKIEVTRPSAAAQSSGVIVCNVQLPPMCGPEFRPGPPSEKAQVLSDFIQEVMSESKMVDFSQLCIEAGLYCWLVHCDVICCNYDGNVRDGVLLAAVGAFKDLSLPKAVYDIEEEQLSVDPEVRSKLDLCCLPIPLSFSLFDDTILLVDPTHEEESVCQGQVTAVTTGGDHFCHIMKHGGASLSPEQLAMCISKSKQRWTDIAKLMEAK